MLSQLRVKRRPKRLDDRLVVFRAHLPHRYAPRIATRMRVGHVEVVAQPSASRLAEHGYADGALVDPAAEVFVPAFHLQHCRCVGALCEHEHLLVKRQLVVSSGGSQKFKPRVWLCNEGVNRFDVKVADTVVGARQTYSPPFVLVGYVSVRFALSHASQHLFRAAKLQASVL